MTTTSKLEFTGTAGEYFGIWIVNLLLSILTLGIYSAWAKVRSQRYFHNNTLLDNSPFDYTASPIAILKGRLIGFAILVVYAALITLVPILELPLLFLLLLAVPWLVVRALIFRRANTTYRNLRFGFLPAYRDAVKIYVGLTLLIPLTLGLIIPHITFRKAQFSVGNSTYGSSRFEFNGTSGRYYPAYLQAAGLVIVTLVVLSIAVAVVLHLNPGIIAMGSDFMNQIQQQLPADSQEQTPNPALMAMVFFVYVVFFFLGYVYYFGLQALITNVTWQNTGIADVRFQSAIQPLAIIGIALSNAILIIISLGLLYPYAKVRMTRYLVSRISVTAPAGLEQFLAQHGATASATGEEVAELFDVDVAL